MPWRKAREGTDAASPVTPRPSSEPGVGAREDVIFLTQENDVPQDQAAVPQPVTSSVRTGSQPDFGEGVRAQILIMDANLLPDEASSNSVSQPSSTDALNDQPPRYAASSSQGSRTNGASHVVIEDQPWHARRTLSWKNFEVALGEIRPSSSEEGSLPELRKVILSIERPMQAFDASPVGRAIRRRRQSPGTEERLRPGFRLR